ncbi:helix-turn-helix domain-containing protein [Rhodococcus erythropolis]|uniref:helix-turn-helix domain-containing protein n=1 Tax=Rhodococcus erythropolis TaxID=1833 RepID=UPI0037A5FD0C
MNCSPEVGLRNSVPTGGEHFVYARSSLSQAQRITAVALFEEGSGRDAIATQLGVSRDPVKALYERVRGTGALVTKPDKETHAFEVKLDAVQRFLAGDTKVELAKEFGLFSPQLIGSWVRKYRHEGEDGLRPQRRGARRDRRHPSRTSSANWSSCERRTSGPGRRSPTWENCGP